MDDITINDSVASVASDIKIIIDDGNAKGMRLNIIKCALISNDISLTIVPFDKFVHVKSYDATLLGTPLLTDQALDVALEKNMPNLNVLQSTFSILHHMTHWFC